MKGLVIELASVVALLAGIYAAGGASDFLASLLGSWLNTDSRWIGYVLFIVAFAAVVAAVYLLAKVIEKALGMVALGVPNKLAGGLFAGIKMAVILSVVLQLLGWLDEHVPFKRQFATEESLIYEPLESIAPTLFPLLRDAGLHQRAKEAIEEEVRNALPESEL